MRRLDPRDRPALNAEALVAALAEHGVTWLLAGSYVLKLHGAEIEPNDLDVVADRTPENLTRLAACLTALDAIPSWSNDPKWNLGTLDDHRAWTASPATLDHLDQLFVTKHGLLDVPFALIPPYETLLPRRDTGPDRRPRDHCLRSAIRPPRARNTQPPEGPGPRRDLRPPPKGPRPHIGVAPAMARPRPGLKRPGCKRITSRRRRVRLARPHSRRLSSNRYKSVTLRLPSDATGKRLIQQGG